MEKDYYEHMCHNSLLMSVIKGEFNKLPTAEKVYQFQGMGIFLSV